MRDCQLIVLMYGIMFYGVHYGHAQSKRIAIIELENNTSSVLSNAEVNSLTSSIRMIFSYLPKDQFLILTQENIEVLLPANTALEDCVGDCEVETGRLLNAHYVISGDVIQFGSQFKSTIKLHDTQSSEYITGVQIKEKSVDALEKAILVSSLQLLYKLYPKFKKNLVAQTQTKDIQKHVLCLLDEFQCRATKSKTSPPNPRQQARKYHTKSKSVESRPKSSKAKPGFFKSLQQSISKLTRIKINKYSKQRIAIFDLGKGAFNYAGETKGSTILLSEAAQKLDPVYFSITTRQDIIKKLSKYKDITCTNHGYCMMLGRKLGVRWIFAGDVIRFGNSLQVFLRLYDVKSGLIRSSEVISAQSMSDLEKAMTPKLLRKMLNMEE